MAAENQTEIKILLDRASFSYGTKEVIRSATLALCRMISGYYRSKRRRQVTLLKLMCGILKPAQGQYF